MMALIALPPKVSFTSVEGLTLARNTQVLRSRFTGQSQRILYPSAVWMFKGKMKDYAPEDAGQIRGFLAALRGQVNTFKLQVPGYVNPSTNIVDNNIAVSVAAASRANSLSLKQMNIVGTVLNIGDYFTIQDELKIVTGALVSDGAGNGVVTFEPPLRKPVAVDVVITINSPYALMHAADDDVASWGIKAPVIHSFDLDAIEAIDL